MVAHKCCHTLQFFAIFIASLRILRLFGLKNALLRNLELTLLVILYST